MNEIITADKVTEFLKAVDRGPVTTTTYRKNLKHFSRYLQTQGKADPTRNDILLYRDLLTAQYKPNTAAQYLRTVKQFFNWTGSTGLYPDIAAGIHGPKVKSDIHRKDALTVQEVADIERSIIERSKTREAAAADPGRTQEQDKRILAMYLLAVNAGLRTVELSRANIKDLELKGGQYFIYIWGKGHSEPDERKPIAQEVAGAILDYLSSRHDNPTQGSPLFVSTGNRSGGKRIAPTTISTMLKRAMKEAGYNSDRITAHSLRHTAGTAVQELTGDLYTTQKYMRHANPQTTEIYLHNMNDKQDAQLAQELYNLYHGTQDSKKDLNRIIETMTPEQIEKLKTIAQAMQ